MEPTLLMLDEPTNHLDLNAVIWLDRLVDTSSLCFLSLFDVVFFQLPTELEEDIASGVTRPGLSQQCLYRHYTLGYVY